MRRMNAVLLLPLLMLASGLCGACSSSEIATKRYGRPDFIGEYAGDQSRYYRPEREPVEAWPHSKKTFFYPTKGFKITFSDHGMARREKVTSDDEELIRVLRLLREAEEKGAVIEPPQ